jgi:NitT/TauT family transport system substrate-binding protein
MWVRDEIVGDDGEMDPCEFEGLTVSFGGTAGFAGTASWWLSEHLADCDLTVADVELSTLGGPDMLIALETGAIDAAFLFDPLWVQAEEGGYAQLVVPQPRVALGGYLFGSLRSERPEVVEAFVRAIARTTRTYLQGDYHADPEVLAGLVETLGVPEETITGSLPLVFDPDLPMDTSPLVPMQEVWMGVGGILEYDEPIAAEELFDLTFRDAVLAGS